MKNYTYKHVLLDKFEILLEAKTVGLGSTIGPGRPKKCRWTLEKE